MKVKMAMMTAMIKMALMKTYKVSNHFPSSSIALVPKGGRDCPDAGASELRLPLRILGFDAVSNAMIQLFMAWDQYGPDRRACEAEASDSDTASTGTDDTELPDDETVEAAILALEKLLSGPKEVIAPQQERKGERKERVPPRSVAPKDVKAVETVGMAPAEEIRIGRIMGKVVAVTMAMTDMDDEDRGGEEDRESTARSGEVSRATISLGFVVKDTGGPVLEFGMDLRRNSILIRGKYI
ncbi:hypothetical protein MKZ38_007715 [Zalerion maritima]|uniref:Uncharacterized protein n=1 Tax=Zalerion maritima TaxID=339359 RepID=A0AAD5WP05_9PEZI|nr:hypothetical protein MKZ38_007715 [Zalerion maritima]